MNKKLMAVAVAGALGAPALAMAQATSNTTIYGRVNVGLDNYSAVGATTNSAGAFMASTSTGNLAARNRVYDSGSRVGIRGSEDLGQGLRAVFTIETGVNVDTGNNNGQSATANSSTGFWASRDSYGGLEGNWGRVSFGRQSIFWTNGTIAQTGANYVNIDAPSATMIAMGRIQGVGARFNNTMMYTFPTIGGFGGYLAYSPQSEATLNSSAGTKTNAHTEGVRVSYEGRVKVQADWAANKSADGANGTVTAAKIVGMKLGLGFPYMPGGQISLIVGQNTDHNLGAAPNFSAAGDSVKQRSYVLNWEHIFGPIQALAMYGRVNDASGCTATNAFNGGANGCEKTGASSYLLGARYLHSKRTSTYVTYNKTANSANNCLDYNAAGYTSASATPLVAAGSCGIAPGSDPRIVALGVLHNF